MPPVVLQQGSGVVKIAVTGQAISLGSIFPNGAQNVSRVDVQALSGNVNSIIVGASQNIATDQSRGGIILNVYGNNQVDHYTIELLTCIQVIFINGTEGDGVSFNYWIGDRN
jgi:hypothetical protein